MSKDVNGVHQLSNVLTDVHGCPWDCPLAVRGRAFIGVTRYPRSIDADGRPWTTNWHLPTSIGVNWRPWTVHECQWT